MIQILSTNYKTKKTKLTEAQIIFDTHLKIVKSSLAFPVCVFNFTGCTVLVENLLNLYRNGTPLAVQVHPKFPL